jgi:small subunit ribosomal protein S1
MQTLLKKSNKKRIFSMDFLLKTMPLNPPKEGDLIDGKILKQKGTSIYIDLQPFGTGIIYGREFNNAKEVIKSLKPGDMITAKIVELENENGYIELSLKEAGQEIIWQEAKESQTNQEIFSLPVLDANKGGLILEWKGVQGFLPASQLRITHYPRVEGGDKEKILEELKKIIGQKLNVTIIDLDPKENKLIFSEKESEADELKEVISKYKVGDVVEGEITGVVDFGIFLKIEEGLEGLAHISELDWSLVENPADLFKVEDKIPAQIISIKDGKISLSVKALKFNPWENAKNKYKKDDTVKGVVIKFNKYGALISIEEGVAGLIHISEFEDEEEMKMKIELGKSYDFKISVFEPEEQRLILTHPDAKEDQPQE